MDLTGVVSDVYMCEWDRHLIGLMEEARMENVVYERYKDDVDFVFRWQADVVVAEGEKG